MSPELRSSLSEWVFFRDIVCIFYRKKVLSPIDISWVTLRKTIIYGTHVLLHYCHIRQQTSPRAEKSHTKSRKNIDIPHITSIWDTHGVPACFRHKNSREIALDYVHKKGTNSWTLSQNSCAASAFPGPSEGLLPPADVDFVEVSSLKHTSGAHLEKRGHWVTLKWRWCHSVPFLS